MRNLVIFGDTLFAERLFNYISFEKIDHVIAFTQEKKFITRDEIHGIPVIPFENLSSSISLDFSIILGIGYTQMNDLRERIFKMCKANGFAVASYISSNAIVYSNNIKDGCFLCPGVIIGPNVVLGIGNFLESGVILSHDNTLGNFNFLSTNVVLGGFTTIDNNCFVGLQTTIKDNIHLCDRILIGSGSNVLKSVEKPESVLVGNPAKIIVNKNTMQIRI